PQRPLEAERGGDQPVGEPGVLRQQGTVEVGAEHVALSYPLVAAATIVSMAFEDAAKRLGAGSEDGAAAVILKSGQDPGRSRLELDLDGDVADQARSISAHGGQVQ